jgi:hypothetical protein
MKSLKRSGVILLSVLLASCGTTLTGKPRRCNESWSWTQMEQYEEVFQIQGQLDGSFVPTANEDLADRVDYLDSYCRSVNKYRDD